MKLRKGLSIVIIALFLTVCVFSFIGLFSVKKINVTFSVSENTDVRVLQETLDGFLDKNLIFLSEDDVYKSLDDFHYMEIVSVSKQFPNIVNVVVNERREIYFLDYVDHYLVMTSDGFLLRVVSKSEQVLEDREKIVLSLDGVSILDATIGRPLRTDKDELLNKVFEMAKSVNLTDCIKKISVSSQGSELSDVTFSTYTGVDIVIQKAEDDGVAKVIEGFIAYDVHASDYEKMFKKIVVNKQDKIKVTWTEKD